MVVQGLQKRNQVAFFYININIRIAAIELGEGLAEYSAPPVRGNADRKSVWVVSALRTHLLVGLVLYLDYFPAGFQIDLSSRGRDKFFFCRVKMNSFCWRPAPSAGV